MNLPTRDTGLYRLAPPSFLTGVARILDFGGFLNEHDAVPAATRARVRDAEAIHSDWAAVGACLQHAMTMDKARTEIRDREQ